MHHLFVAPTFISLASMVAARRAGLYDPSARTTLMLTNNAAIPEVQPGLAALPGFDSLAAEFDEVVTLNDLIYPYHPRTFTPRGAARDALRQAIADRCGGEHPATITAQSLHVKPTSFVVDLFPEARLSIVSDGLMSYGPTRFNVPEGRSARIDRLLHLDLVPGLVPVLLSEHGVAPVVIPSDSFRQVLATFGEGSGVGVRDEAGRPDAILLGQYLAALGLLTVEEEECLHLDMLRVALARGARSVVFKPHPSAPPVFTERITALAADLGISLEVLADSTPVEVLYERWRPRMAVGCFSTGLATAHSVFGIDVCSTGTERVARALPRFEDSNRVPLALTHAAHTRANVDQDGRVSFAEPGDVDLQLLVNELSHAMQPRDYPYRETDRSAELLAGPGDLDVFFEAPVRRSTPSTPAPRAQRGLRDRARIASYRLEERSPAFAQEWVRLVRARSMPLR